MAGVSLFNGRKESVNSSDNKFGSVLSMNPKPVPVNLLLVGEFHGAPK